MVQELSNIAVQIKTNTYQGNLTYSQIKSIIFEFNDCLNKININVNPFIMIEMILLNGFEEVEVASSKPVDTSKKIEQILSKNKKKEVIIEDKSLEEVTTHSEDTLEPSDFQELKRVRVNNCFVDAKKEDLIRLKALWNQSKSIEVFSPDLLSLVMDSDVVAASSKYMILTTKLESNVNNINRNIDDIEETFKQQIKIVCLSNEEWTKEKKVYVSNLKKGVKYEMIAEEPRPKKKEIESEMDSIATNVFNRDKIEVV